MSARSRKNDVKTIPVPCGQCVECKKATLSGWLFRFEQELKISDNPLFVTLTYKDETVPWGDGSFSDVETRKTHGYKSLRPRDLQLFMKNLRRYHEEDSDSKLRFLAVGEYGSRTHRPHYHLIVLNLKDESLIAKAWSYKHNPKDRTEKPKSMGFDYTLPLLDGGLQYVLKYMSKPKHRPPGCVSMFSRFSKGIGLSYLTKARQEFHLQGPEFSYHRLVSGAKIPLIKYFKEKLFTSDQRQAVTEYQAQRSEERKSKRIRSFAHSKRKTYEFSENILEYRKKSVTFDKELPKAQLL